MKDRAKWMDNHLPGSCLAPLNVQNTAQNDLEITIAPNPMNTHTVISFYGNKLGGTKKLYVFDITGRLVRQQETISNSSFVLERGDLPSGVYFIKIATEQHQFVSRKFAVE
jgi:hypothetical protein